MTTKPLNYYGYAFDKPLDKAEKKHKKKLRKQLAKHGLDQSEVWALDVTIAKFILPRLKLLRKTHHGYPPNLTDKKWKEILKKMENSFQVTIDDTLSKDNQLQHALGLNLFAQYFSHLWD